MKKKKLLLITNGFPFGDSERGFLSTEFHCLQEQFDLYILARNTTASSEAWKQLDYDAEKVWAEEDKPLQPLPVFMQIFRRDVLQELAEIIMAKGGIRLLIKRISLILRYSARAEKYQKCIDEICQENQIEMIYSYWCTQATLAAVRYQKSHNELKIITRFHGYDLYNERLPELWQPFRNIISVKCDLLVFACKKGAIYFREHWEKTLQSRMLVSYLGCPPMEQVCCFDSPVIHLVSCSNLIELKRVDLIIRALSQTRDGVRIDWHHFGDGVLRKNLEQLCRNLLDCKKNISWTFHGAVANDSINQCYQACGADIFITTSSTEGIPVSIQEAMAMGIPTIATDVGGISELVIPGKTGWLLASDPEVSEIVQAIETAAFSEKRAQFGRKAKELWAKSFNSYETAKELSGMLLSIASHKDEDYNE